MATDTRETIEEGEEAAEAAGPREGWYDRSSLVGDFMVMIADQTVEDYLRRAPEDRFCEYVDGIVYMPSPVEMWHQFETQFLSCLLEFFTADRQLCHILTGPAALRIREECFLEPDVFAVPFDAEAQFQGVFCDPPVLLVVEIVSKSTRSRDLNDKAELYRQAGALEVWFIDLRDSALIVHRKVEDGYEVERIEHGPYLSRAVPGFWIDVAWLWARPRPDIRACLELIMAGPPA